MPTPSLEQRVARLEAELAHLKSPPAPAAPEPPWWEKFSGMFADDPYFEEAVVIGREYRDSLGMIENATEALSNLPEKPNYSLQEAIKHLQQPIAEALQRQYTFLEIAQILTNQGIAIKAAELSKYYSAAKPTPRQKYRPQSSRKAGKPYGTVRSCNSVQPV
jgi:hypothetical protein